jgi:putative hemolysin
MMKIGAFLLLTTIAWAVASPAQAVLILGGKGAPQSENCKSQGGSETGQMCALPDGRSCDSMALMRESKCVGEDGLEILPEEPEEDFGSNDGSDTSGDTESSD